MRDEGLLQKKERIKKDLTKEFGGEEYDSENALRKVKNCVNYKYSCDVDWKKYAEFHNSANGNNYLKNALKTVNDLLRHSQILTRWNGFEIKGFEFYVESEGDKLRFEKRTEASKLARALGIPISDIEYVY